MDDTRYVEIDLRFDTECIRLGPDIVIYAFRKRRSQQVAIGIAAPIEVPIWREELLREMTPEQAQAAYDAAEPVPLSEERIKEIVEYATGRRTRE